MYRSGGLKIKACVKKCRLDQVWGGEKEESGVVIRPPFCVFLSQLGFTIAVKKQDQLL